MPEINRLLDAAQAGDRQAAAQLLPLVYDELRKLAAARMAAEIPGHTLSATALVHEAYLRLLGDQQFDGRGHFFAAAAEAMRRILIDKARRRNRIRHGQGLARVDLDKVDVAMNSDDETLLRVDEALLKLAREEPVKAELVKLRFFIGLSIAKAGQALGLSESTAKRYWVYARAWLYEELRGVAK
jgi:RNA polymerase sigma factor (TIGR02999 family)